jgi:hypothetical protein
MGTSIGYSLPTSGNWPDVKRETTSLGTTGVADAGNVGKLMSHYVQAHGGSGRAAQQMSAASRAGAKLAGFLVGVQRDGLTQTLVNVGLGELVGQPVPSVLRGLTDYLAGPGSLLGITVKVTRARSCGKMGRQQQFKRRSAVHAQNGQASGSAGAVHLQSRV